jgi:hypothetical protein
MMAASETSIPRSAPIPIPGRTKPSHRCCSQRGRENQQDGNIGLEVKDTAFLNTASVSEESVVKITIEDSPVLSLSSHHFSKTEDPRPKYGQLPSPECDRFPPREEERSDLELATAGLHCTELSTENVPVPNDVNSLISFEIICPPGMDLEAELKDAMDSSLPHPEVEPETTSSTAAPVLETSTGKGEGSKISLTESFSRTRSSLSSIDGHSAPSHSFHIEKPNSHLGSDFVDVEEYLINPSDSFPHLPYPALDSSAMTEDFWFRPTCEWMPGPWPSPNPRKREDMPTNAIRLLTPDLGDAQGFITSKEEVLKGLEKELPPLQNMSLAFSICRPVPDINRQTLHSPSLSPTTDPDSPTPPHLRGGGDEARFSLFRTFGKGKLVGNVERGKKLLDEQVSGSYMIGGWGQNETWKEFCVKMETRVEKRKEIEKIEVEIERLKAEKKSDKGDESEGALKALLARVKGLFGSGDGEKGEQKTGEDVVVVPAEQTTVPY